MKVKVKYLKKFSLLFLFFFLGTFAKATENAKLIEAMLSAWRSQDSYIDGGTLREESELFIPAKLRRALAESTQISLLKELKSKTDAPWFVTRADVENILKIRKISQHTRNFIRPFINEGPLVHGFQNEIKDLSQAKLDEILKPFSFPESNSENTPKARRIFSYRVHKIKSLALKSIIDNDLYAFTVGAVLFDLGFHESKEAVFENLSRGADAYPYMVADGQDQIVDLLENLRFTRWEIEALKKHVESKIHVNPKFWDWLAKWRFRGSIRSLPVATVVFPGTPINQIICDPVSAIIVESLINPWMSSATNLLTTAVRNMLAARGIKTVTEAGTRRVISGNLSARAAILAGAQGTSNVLTATLQNSAAYGTMNHASIALFPTEMEAFEAFAVAAKNPTLILPDTYDMRDGLRTAVRAGGDQIASFRMDSNLTTSSGAHMSTLESIRELRSIWKSIGKGHWGGVVTNDLTEETLNELAQSDLSVESASMGGAFATSSKKVAHGNFVYKLVELRDVVSKKVVFPIKAAQGKSTEPGEKNVWRVTDNDGRYLADFKERPGIVPEFHPQTSAKQMLVTLMSKGKRVQPRAERSSVVEYIQEQLGHVDPAILDPSATRSSLGSKNYRINTSWRLSEIGKEALRAVQPREEFRILVFPGSFDPVTEEGHVAMAKRINELFKNKNSPHGFDKIIFVPTGDNPVHGRKYQLSGLARIEQLRRALKNIPQAEIFTDEVALRDDYAINTLRKIETLNPEAKITIAMGDEVFWGIAGVKPWKEAAALLNNYNFVVSKRYGPNSPEDKINTEKFLIEANYVKKVNRYVNPNGKQIEFFNPNLSKPNISATQVRDFYNQQNVAGFFHLTGRQSTFAARLNYPSHDQFVDGALKVAGTELTVGNLSKVTEETLGDNIFKSSLSAEAHFDEEVKRPGINDEFHAPRNFIDPHYLEYVEWLDPYKVLPHFHAAWCTDFCDYFVLKAELERGYNSIFIIDTATGVFPKLNGQRLRELLDLGLKVISTQEYLALHKKWKAEGAKWHNVLNDLSEWEKTSRTQENLIEALKDPRFADPDHNLAADFVPSCALFLDRQEKKF